jgi:hypothetical protein
MTKEGCMEPASFQSGVLDAFFAWALLVGERVKNSSDLGERQ